MRVINNLRDKTSSETIKNLLEKNPGELFVKMTNLVQTYYKIKTENKLYCRNYGNDAGKWLAEEKMSWAKEKGFSPSQMREIMDWGWENYNYFLHLPASARVNIGFSRYRTDDIDLKSYDLE